MRYSLFFLHKLVLFGLVRYALFMFLPSVFSFPFKILFLLSRLTLCSLLSFFLKAARFFGNVTVSTNYGDIFSNGTITFVNGVNMTNGLSFGTSIHESTTAIPITGHLHFDDHVGICNITIEASSERTMTIYKKVYAGTEQEAKAISDAIVVTEEGTHCIMPLSFNGEIRVTVKMPEANGIDVSTKSGSIAITGAFDDVYAKSMSGSIKAMDIRAGILKSMSGSCRVKSNELKKLKAESMSGSIHVTGKALPGIRVSGKSMSGDVETSAPAGKGHDVVGKMSGSVSIELS